VGGLPAPVYNLVRYSGEARVAAAAAIVDKYLQDADYDAILADAGSRTLTSPTMRSQPVT
jgi:hypothetical protein